MTQPKADGLAGLDELQNPLYLLEGLEKGCGRTDLEDALQHFARVAVGLDGIAREVARETAIQKLKDLGYSSPARLIDAALPSPEKAAGEGQGETLALEDPEPAPGPVDGAVLLDAIAATLRRFVAMADESVSAVALWILHTYALEAFFVSPILAITSPEKRCGKTTLLTVLSALSLKALPSSNCTSSVLFRAVEKFRPTLLIDEADTFLLGKTADPELRGIINSGHTRMTAYVLRSVGDDFEPRRFSTWAPKAVALIGDLRGTMGDRSITIRMRRRGPGEKVERLRADRLRALEPIQGQAARWAADHLKELHQADPEVPEEIASDRAQDNWRPLLAIADEAGGEWPAKARKAATKLCESESAIESYGVLLLHDVRDLFQREGVDRLNSADIVHALVALEERPWSDSHDGKPLTPPRLARLLRPFEIAPKTIRQADGKTPKGYHLEQFEDAFSRYLCPPEAQQRHNVDRAIVPAKKKTATAPGVLRAEKAAKAKQGVDCGGVAVSDHARGREDRETLTTEELVTQMEQRRLALEGATNAS